jgi:deoxyribodipyrimidine photo-lyase
MASAVEAPCEEEAVEARVIPTSAGPCIWWARNDLRVQDNPVLRAVVGAALADRRPFTAVFCFDPRFLDRSPYGRVTDPEFKRSISTRKPVTFSARKTCALRARFWIQCVVRLGEELERRGSKLLVCHGRPEDVLGALPEGSEVKCLPEPVSIEQTDVEEFVRARLVAGGSKLRTDPGAMSLYHPDDLPFHPRDRPDSFTGLGFALGWKDIWTSAERADGAAHIRGPVPAPKEFPPPPAELRLPGQIPTEVLADERRTLLHLGYTEEEIQEVEGQDIPEGGEPAARLWLERWAAGAKLSKAQEEQPPAVYWDLPCGGQSGPTAGEVDPMQWATLTTPFGGIRISCYMAVGCITAREILHRAQETPFYPMAAHRLMWREFHRMYAIKYHRRVAWLQGPARVTRTWSEDPEIADKWKRGLTGVPYIDACQRELLKTGWLAYKGRKTAAHFLVFDLWMDWRIGAFHDEERLLDYDFAMNYGNWAVVSKIGNGGASAWDGSRDFDPEHWDLRFKLHAEQVNDPSGAYIRQWVPELRGVDDRFIHTPWLMSKEDMRSCGCVVGVDYPASLVGPLDIKCDWGMDEHPSQGNENPSYAELKEQLEAKDRELAALRADAAK